MFVIRSDMKVKNGQLVINVEKIYYMLKVYDENGEYARKIERW